MLTGGGSGGHITPILAVAHELKRAAPDVKLVYVGQKGDKLDSVLRSSPDIDEIRQVRAGKFRRYHGEGLRQLLDLPTLLKNVRDFFWVLIGIVQSYRLIGRYQPDGLFVRGGYVGVPVALAAALRRVPYVTHDSDAVPSLANRIIARWAAWHAVALPKELYRYPQNKTVCVGVPVAKDFQPVSEAQQTAFKQSLGYDPKDPLLLVTGGGHGAVRVNSAIVRLAPELLSRHRQLRIVHIAGKDNETEVKKAYRLALQPDQRGRVQVEGFVHDLFRYSGAADIIVSRAGATNLAEYAAQAKAVVVVPNPMLTGGHQLKNAQHLADTGAIVTVTEADIKKSPEKLGSAISELLDSERRRRQLGQRLAQYAKPEAASQLATLLIRTFGAEG